MQKDTLEHYCIKYLALKNTDTVSHENRLNVVILPGKLYTKYKHFFLYYPLISLWHICVNVHITWIPFNEEAPM